MRDSTFERLLSVFDPNGKKIADCGALRDAVNLVGMRNARWEGHYYQFKPIYNTIDVSSQQYLSSKEIEFVEIEGPNNTNTTKISKQWQSKLILTSTKSL